MSGAAKGFDLSGLDLPALQHLAAVLPPLIALREVLDAQGGMMRVSLVDQHSFNAVPLLEPAAPVPPAKPANPFDPARVKDAWAGVTLAVRTETVAPMQTSPQGAAATDDLALAGVAAPADAGHPLPAASSPDAVKPAPAVDSSSAAGASGPVDRLTAYLKGVPRRGPWTVATDCDLMRRVCDGAKVAEIAMDAGIDGGAVRDRIKVLTEAGKWRKEAVLDRLQRMVGP